MLKYCKIYTVKIVKYNFNIYYNTFFKLINYKNSISLQQLYCEVKSSKYYTVITYISV